MKLLGFSVSNDYEALTPEEVLTALGITSTIAELNYTDGVTSNIQTQLNGKQASLASSTSITLSGNQLLRAALTGDVTAAANSNNLTIANRAVSPAKMVAIPTGQLLGRNSPGTGDIEILSPSTALAMLGVQPGATAGANWNTNLSNIPTNITSWAGIAPSEKFDYALATSTGIYGTVNPVGGDPDTHFGTPNARFARIINIGSNLPFPWGVLIQSPYSATEGAQLAMSVTTNQVAWRRSVATGWQEIYHSGNLDLDQYVNTSSDQTIGGIKTFSSIVQAQRFDTANNYSSTGNTVNLSPGTAGTISLRPQGLGQTANQTQITSNGNMTVGGTISDTDGDVRKMKGRVSNAATTLAASDLNGVVEKNNNTAYTYTLAASLGTVRDAITIVNSGTAGNITLARASGVALYRNGVDANITIGPGSMVTIYRSNTANRWIA